MSSRGGECKVVDTSTLDRFMRRGGLALVWLLTPLLMGGAHCGMTNYAGPVIDQDAIGHQDGPIYISLVRFRRERPAGGAPHRGRSARALGGVDAGGSRSARGVPPIG